MRLMISKIHLCKRKVLPEFLLCPRCQMGYTNAWGMNSALEELREW